MINHNKELEQENIKTLSDNSINNHCTARNGLKNSILLNSNSKIWKDAVCEWIIIGTRDLHRTVFELSDTVEYIKNGETLKLKRIDTINSINYKHIPMVKNKTRNEKIAIEKYTDDKNEEHTFEVRYYEGKQNMVNEEGILVKPYMRCECGKIIKNITKIFNLTTYEELIIGGNCAQRFDDWLNAENFTNDEHILEMASSNTRLLHKKTTPIQLYNSTEIMDDTVETTEKKEYKIITENSSASSLANDTKQTVKKHYDSVKNKIGNIFEWTILSIEYIKANEDARILDPFLEMNTETPRIVGCFYKGDDIIILPSIICKTIMGVYLSKLETIKRRIRERKEVVLNLVEISHLFSIGVIDEKVFEIYKGISTAYELHINQLVNDGNINDGLHISVKQSNFIEHINRIISSHLKDVNQLLQGGK